MSVSGVSTNTATQSTNPQTSLLGGQDTEQTFMTMLITELQNQDPLSPMDPESMVAQLVQLNTLSEVMGIHQTLNALVNGTNTAASNG